MKDNVKYEFHHFGIPLQDGKNDGIFSEKAGMRILMKMNGYSGGT